MFITTPLVECATLQENLKGTLLSMYGCHSLLNIYFFVSRVNSRENFPEPILTPNQWFDIPLIEGIAINQPRAVSPGAKPFNKNPLFKDYKWRMENYILLCS